MSIEHLLFLIERLARSQAKYFFFTFLRRNINIGLEPVAIMQAQGEFNFSAATSSDGHAHWLAGRQLAAAELARRVGLPIGHDVEVWLRGGIRLRGKLRLQEEPLMIEEDRLRHLEMLVDHVPFFYRDMDSCIRTD